MKLHTIPYADIPEEKFLKPGFFLYPMITNGKKIMEIVSTIETIPFFKHFLNEMIIFPNVNEL